MLPYILRHSLTTFLHWRFFKRNMQEFHSETWKLRKQEPWNKSLKKWWLVILLTSTKRTLLISTPPHKKKKRPRHTLNGGGHQGPSLGEAQKCGAINWSIGSSIRSNQAASANKYYEILIGFISLNYWLIELFFHANVYLIYRSSLVVYNLQPTNLGKHRLLIIENNNMNTNDTDTASYWVNQTRTSC